MEKLVDLLALGEDGPDRFVAPNGKGGWVSLFGGQIVAQALAAASATVPDDRLPHSLHAYFLRPGAFDAPIALAVERERDGASFSSRRVVASQNGKPILSLIASYHTSETGPSRDGQAMPDVPSPDGLAVVNDSAMTYGRSPSDPSPLTYIDVRPIVGCRPFEVLPPEPPLGRMWFRFRDGGGAGPAVDRSLLAYASDLFLINSALQPHRADVGKGVMIASIDHSLWIHDQPDLGDWLLYVQESDWAGGGRAMCRGSIFGRDGRHVATVVQEALLRLGTKMPA
jgi:acyl-CoA thioesterase-2